MLRVFAVPPAKPGASGVLFSAERGEGLRPQLYGVCKGVETVVRGSKRKVKC